jgi:hypothetical protein
MTIPNQKEHTMIRSISFYDWNFDLIKSIPITRPVPPCWQPSEDLDACTAIQAVSNGHIIGMASKVNTVWAYNLVGGAGHLPDRGSSHQDSLREIATFMSEALLLSESAT